MKFFFRALSLWHHFFGIYLENFLYNLNPGLSEWYANHFGSFKLYFYGHQEFERAMDHWLDVLLIRFLHRSVSFALIETLQQVIIKKGKE